MAKRFGKICSPLILIKLEIIIIIIIIRYISVSKLEMYQNIQVRNIRNFILMRE